MQNNKTLTLTTNYPTIPIYKVIALRRGKRLEEKHQIFHTTRSDHQIQQRNAEITCPIMLKSKTEITEHKFNVKFSVKIQCQIDQQSNSLSIAPRQKNSASPNIHSDPVKAKSTSMNTHNTQKGTTSHKSTLRSAHTIALTTQTSLPIKEPRERRDSLRYPNRDGCEPARSSCTNLQPYLHSLPLPKPIRSSSRITGTSSYPECTLRRRPIKLRYQSKSPSHTLLLQHAILCTQFLSLSLRPVVSSHATTLHWLQLHPPFCLSSFMVATFPRPLLVLIELALRWPEVQVACNPSTFGLAYKGTEPTRSL